MEHTNPTPEKLFKEWKKGQRSHVRPSPDIKIIDNEYGRSIIFTGKNKQRNDEAKFINEIIDRREKIAFLAGYQAKDRQTATEIFKEIDKELENSITFSKINYLALKAKHLKVD